MYVSPAAGVQVLPDLQTALAAVARRETEQRAEAEAVQRRLREASEQGGDEGGGKQVRGVRSAFGGLSFI